MKIFRFEETELTPKFYTLNNFSYSNGILSFTIGADGVRRLDEGDFIVEHSINLNNWKGKVLDVYILYTNSGYEVRDIDIMKNCSIGNGMPTMQVESTENSIRIFRCAVRDKPEETFIHLAHGHEEIEGVVNEIIPQKYAYRRLKAFVDLDPFAASLITKYRNKSDMQNKIDFKDSISYLEAQVDLLTRYILNGASPELVTALTSADEYSVLNIKNMSKVSEEFTNKKAKVREAQSAYYSSETSNS